MHINFSLHSRLAFRLAAGSSPPRHYSFCLPAAFATLPSNTWGQHRVKIVLLLKFFYVVSALVLIGHHLVIVCFESGWGFLSWSKRNYICGQTNHIHWGIFLLNKETRQFLVLKTNRTFSLWWGATDVIVSIGFGFVLLFLVAPAVLLERGNANSAIHELSVQAFAPWEKDPTSGICNHLLFLSPIVVQLMVLLRRLHIDRSRPENLRFRRWRFGFRGSTRAAVTISCRQ